MTEPSPPRHSRLRLSPLPAVAAFLALSCNVFWIDSPAHLALILGGLLLLFVGLRARLGFFKWLLLMSVAGVPFTVVVFWIAAAELTGDWRTALPLGLRDALRFVLRLKVVVFANILLVQTTSQRELTACLRSLRLPEGVVLFVSTVIRFLPLSYRECGRILQTQRCRGLRLRGLMDPRNLLPLVVPLLLSHMRRAHEMALSLEIRHFAWQPAGARVPLLHGTADWLALTLTAAMLLHPIALV